MDFLFENQLNCPVLAAHLLALTVAEFDHYFPNFQGAMP